MQAESAPIFVVDTGRSGSTLLRLMLCAHPHIHLTQEASFYVWEGLGPHDRGAPRAALDYYLRSFSFRWLRLEPAAVLAALGDPPSLADAWAAVMRLVAARHGCARFGDRTPGHAGSLAQIYEDFPDARVIRVVRDPRATVLSLSRMPWASASLYANALLVDYERKQVLPFRDRLHEVRLEDLLADPRAEMIRVLDFVGEPWDDAVLDHASHLPVDDEMPPLPWLLRARRPLGEPSARWRTELSPAEIRAVEWLCRQGMEQQGYERAELPREPGRLRVTRAAMGSVPEATRFAARYAKLGKLYKDPAAFDSEEARQVFRTLNPPSWELYPGFEMPRPP